MIKFILFTSIILSFIISSEKQEIIESLEEYYRAFEKADYSKIADCFDYPMSFNLENKTITASNKFKLKLIYRKIRGELPDYYSYSKIEKINIQLTDNNIAIINANFSRYTNDSTAFHSESAQYYLRFKKNKWKIFSMTPYKNIKKLDE